MTIKRFVTLGLLPVFMTLAFIGLPPPNITRLKPNPQQQEQTLEKKS